MGKKQTEALSISSGENILRPEGKISSLWSTRNLEKLHLIFFLFWWSCLCHKSSVQILTSFIWKPFTLRRLNLREREWERGQRLPAVVFELSSVLGPAADWAVQISCLSLLQPPPFTSEPSTKHLVPGSCSRMQVPVDLLDVHLWLTLLTYDHNTGLCPVRSISQPGRNVGGHFYTYTFPCTLVFLSTQGR